MSPTLATEAAWVTVRCPCRRNTLGEVRGSGGTEFRRYCRDCKGWWIVSIERGEIVVRPDPTAMYRARA